MNGQEKFLLSILVMTIFAFLAGGSIITGEPRELWFWGIGFVVVIIFVSVFQIKQTNKRHEAIERLKSSSDFKTTTEIVDYDAKYWVGINNTSSEIKIILLNSNGEHNKEYLLKFANIISVELIEDGKTTFSKSAFRTIGGAAVGGVLAGGVGAIVGGLSGGSEENRSISRMDIKLLLRDYYESSIIIEEYSGVEVKTSDLVYKMVHQQAMELIDHIKIIIDKVNKETCNVDQNKSSISNSIAEEIIQLNNLREKGIISEDEFQRLKDKLVIRE